MNRKWWLLVAVIAALLALLLYATVGRERAGSRRAAASANAGGGGAATAPVRIDRHDPRGDASASVGGIVRDVRGVGVAGAWVCGTVWRSRELSEHDTREPRCTSTDAGGRWRLEALWPGRWGIGAGAPKLRPTEWEDPQTRTGGVRLAAGEDRGGIDLVLEDGGVLAEGTVLDLTGGTIAAAFVTVTSAGWRGGGATCRARSGDDGTFSCWVAPGRVWAAADVDGYAEGWAEGIVPGEQLEVLLTPESTLGGVVVSAGTTTPVAGARVEIRGEWGNRGQVFSDDAGRFRFSRLAPGRYKPVATTPGGYGEAAESVLLGLAQSRDDLLIELHPAAAVTASVAVAAPDGKPGGPASECDVSLSRNDGRSYDDRTEADGKVAFEAVQPGTYQVSIDCDRQVSRVPYPDVVVGDAAVDALTWLVDAGVELRGLVVDEQGAPIAHAGVRARNVGGDPRAARGGGADDSDRDGRFVIEGLKAGAIEIDVGADGYPDPVDPTKVELPAAGTEVRLVLVAGGRIDGIVVDETGAPLGKLDVSARGERGGDNTRVRDDGTFTLAGLRTGDYRVRTSRDGELLRRPGTSDDDLQGQRVAVAAGETATVRLVVETSSGAITGRVIDATGAAVTDAFVRVERESEAAGRQRGGALRGARWSWSQRPAVTDLDGRFTVGELAPGSYTVLAYRKGGSEASAEGVAVGADVVLTVAPTASLSGTVETGGAAPRELQVSLADPDTGVWRSESFFRSDGSWTVRDLPAGKYDVTAKAVEGTVSIEDVELADGQQRTGVTLTLRGTVSVTGRVIDATGAPVAAISVMAQPVEGADAGSWRTGGGTDHVSDASGRFTVKDVPQGRIRLMARPRDRDSPYTRGVRVTDATGAGTIDIGDVVVLQRRLARGVRAGDLGFTLVELAPDTDPADVVLKVANVRADGPAATSGLVAGDVIVSVDGRDVRGEQSWQYNATVSAPEGTTVSFGLERGATATVRLGRPE